MTAGTAYLYCGSLLLAVFLTWLHGFYAQHHRRPKGWEWLGFFE